MSKVGLGIYNVTVTATGVVGNESFMRVSKDSFVVEPIPDLSVTAGDIMFSNNLPTAGDNVTVYVAVRNVGRTVANATVSFYDGNLTNPLTFIGEVNLSVGPGSPAGGSVNWMVPSSGNHTIHVLVYNELDENDSNNAASSTLTALRKYELRMTCYTDKTLVPWDTINNLTVSCDIQDYDFNPVSVDFIAGGTLDSNGGTLKSFNLTENATGRYMTQFSGAGALGVISLNVNASKENYTGYSLSTVYKVVCGKGDLNCDGIINDTDSLEFEKAYKTVCNETNYNNIFDFNDDCKIDLLDFVNLARRYKK